MYAMAGCVCALVGGVEKFRVFHPVLEGSLWEVDEDLPTNRGAISGLVASRAQSGGAQARRSPSSVYAARDEF